MWLALSLYIGAAIAFGIVMWITEGGQLAGEFFAGWLTEYSPSVDNLFIFLLIMAKFAVPERYQQYALMIGIIIAIVLRGFFHLGGRGGHQQLLLGLTSSAPSSSTPRSSWPARVRATTRSSRRTPS